MRRADGGLELHFFRPRRLRVVHQTEAAECGLACLAMILQRHGRRYDLPGLRRLWPMSLKGLTLARLIEVAQDLDLAARPLRLDVGELGGLRLPCILHWDMEHFVVLERVGRRSITILDPAIGRREPRLREVSRRFTGIALELVPTSSFRPAVQTRTLRLSHFFSATKGLAASLTQLFLLSAALQVFVLTAPFYSQLVIDDVISSGDTDLLAVLATGFGILAVLLAATTAVRQWVVVYLSSTLSFAWSESLFRHLIRLPCDYFAKRRTGDIQSRFQSLAAVRELIATEAVEAVIDGLMAIATVAVMYLYSPTLAAVVIASVIAYLTLRLLLFDALRSHSLEHIVNAARSESHLLESLRGVLAIRNFGKETNREMAYKNLLAEAVRSSAASRRVAIWQNAGNQSIFGIQNVAVIWIAANDVIAGTFTIGMMVAFIAYKTHFAARASALVDKYFQFRLARIHLDRLADIVDTDPETARALPVPDAGNDPGLTGRIELDGVWYRYGRNEPYVVRDRCLCIDAGETVAITGASGCGKSTVMKLMIGLLLPEKGRVLYDGQPLQRIGLQRLRQQIGVVMQDDRLLSGTLLDNVSFFSAMPDRDRVEKCIELAGIADEIRRLPMGLYTLVGDMGDALSGGQRQRIMLARALYHDPAVLFLDESTSHLDEAREVHVISAIAKLNRTTVVIAHRRETIRQCDRVIYL